MVSDAGDILTLGSNRQGQLGIGRPDMEAHPYPLNASTDSLFNGKSYTVSHRVN